MCDYSNEETRARVIKAALNLIDKTLKTKLAIHFLPSHANRQLNGTSLVVTWTTKTHGPLFRASPSPHAALPRRLRGVWTWDNGKKKNETSRAFWLKTTKLSEGEPGSPHACAPWGVLHLIRPSYPHPLPHTPHTGANSQSALPFGLFNNVERGAKGDRKEAELLPSAVGDPSVTFIFVCVCVRVCMCVFGGLVPD